MNTHATGNRMLLGASGLLLAAVLLHGVDHSLQERGVGALTTEVLIGGGVNAALAVIAFVLARRNHPRAPAVAAGVGTYLVVRRGHRRPLHPPLERVQRSLQGRRPRGHLIRPGARECRRGRGAGRSGGARTDVGCPV